MTIREQLEEREGRALSPHACLARASEGRLFPETEHEYRTAFQRDRDRILHSKAFRRLKRKTQVFLAPQDDHYRTRLTHTLEVAQIARTIARALLLNEDLTEAIALGHDLGHTPFGHAGETALNEVYEQGFNHSEQSLRCVDKLESTQRGRGLNLTMEVREGIANHSKGKAVLSGKPMRCSATLEGDIVSVADAIAYVNHDIDDAIRGGLITIEELPRDAIRLLGLSSSARINSMVGAVIRGTSETETKQIYMSVEAREAMMALRAYLYEQVYPCEAIDREVRKARSLVRELYRQLVDAPLPESLAGDPEDSLERRTVDFLAGMTDDYALRLYGRLFLPARWET